jgi:hypothetical protein
MDNGKNKKIEEKEEKENLNVFEKLDEALNDWMGTGLSND